MALVSGELSEKIGCTMYFLTAKSYFANAKNNPTHIKASYNLVINSWKKKTTTKQANISMSSLLFRSFCAKLGTSVGHSFHLNH